MFEKSGLFGTLKISVSGLQAQVTRLKTIAGNLVNYKTTGTTPGADPYTRQLVTFKNVMDRNSGVKHVKVGKVVRDRKAYIEKYEPSHPAADPVTGMVKYPNVTRLVEINDQRDAQRSYEAIMGTIDVIREMIRNTISIIGKA